MPRGARARRQSCRKLHAVFAATNDEHCAHISFKPMADPKGRFKDVFWDFWGSAHFVASKYSWAIFWQFCREGLSAHEFWT